MDTVWVEEGDPTDTIWCEVGDPMGFVWVILDEPTSGVTMEQANGDGPKACTEQVTRTWMS